ncbi:uncharacterized protein V1518DRAFT_413096 [Limtongia smithiae]|uniref:uncharacterized protein n=1 Tax=Limtongia smithiae TaxID=1125753 RepID=UPI0034CF2BA5
MRHAVSRCLLTQYRPLTLAQFPAAAATGAAHLTRNYASRRKTRKSKAMNIIWPTSPIIPTEGDKRRENRQARMEKFPKNSTTLQFADELPVDDVVAWLSDTSPKTPSRRQEQALTDQMRETLRRQEWDVVVDDGSFSQLVRHFKFTGFHDSFLFLARMSQFIAVSEHFPEIQWEDNDVYICLTTYGDMVDMHASGAHYVSKADVDMAFSINQIIDEIRAQSAEVNSNRVGKRLEADIRRVVKTRDDGLLSELVENVLTLRVT